jgi:hypothetical protein
VLPRTLAGAHLEDPDLSLRVDVLRVEGHDALEVPERRGVTAEALVDHAAIVVSALALPVAVDRLVEDGQRGAERLLRRLAGEGRGPGEERVCLAVLAVGADELASQRLGAMKLALGERRVDLPRGRAVAAPEARAAPSLPVAR